MDQIFETFMMVFAIVILASLIAFFVGYLMKSIGYRLLYNKVFGESTWKAFVPFYNDFIVCNHLGVLWLFWLKMAAYISLPVLLSFSIIIESTNITAIIYDILLIVLTILKIVFEYFLVKRISQSPLFCIFNIFFPNLTILINGIICVDNRGKYYNSPNYNGNNNNSISNYNYEGNSYNNDNNYNNDNFDIEQNIFDSSNSYKNNNNNNNCNNSSDICN